MAVATAEYLDRFKKGVKKRLAKRGGTLTTQDIESAHREARAGAGGVMRAAKNVKAEDQIELDDDDLMADDDLISSLEIAGSFEDIREDLQEVLTERYGKYISIVATFPDHVIYCQYPADGSYGDPTYYAQSYTGTGDDEDVDETPIKFGNRVVVERATTFKPVKAEDGNSVTVELADPLGTNRKSIYVYTRNSTIEIPDDDPDDPEEETDEETEEIAFTLIDDRRINLADEQPLEGVRTLVSLRLADTPGTNGTIPEWQQYHKIGECAVEHGVSGKIALTRKMGDNMIRNFSKNVLRKPLTLDENHNSAGPALAKAVKLEWGNEGDGLPGNPEPKGKGDILFVRWQYSPRGVQKLTDGEYYNQSPQYEYDYVDKESGKHYGVTATGCAATNNPYLRLQTWQGEAAPSPVLLTDAAPIHKEIEKVTQNQNGQPNAISLEEWTRTQKQLSDLLARDEAREKELNRANEQIAALSGNDRGHAVKILLDDKMRAGLDPALANIARPILLALDPNESAESRPVRLSDDAAAEPVNLYDAVTALVNAIPVRPVDRTPRTSINGDTRPLTNGAALQDAEQIKLQNKQALEYFNALGNADADTMTPTQRASQRAVTA